MASRSETVEGARRPAKKRIPWFLVAALAVSTYVFWILPTQLEDRPVKVEFGTQGSSGR